MKVLIFIVFYFIALSFSASAQSLDVFNIDASAFPVVRANFYAFDRDGKSIQNLAPADFKITENGIERTVTKISCPVPKPVGKVSIAMSIDISGSMGGGIGTTDIPVELGKTTASNIASIFSLPPNEMALQTCHDRAFINLDFTTSRQRVLDAISPVMANGGNDFVEHLLNPETGLLNIAKNGKNKRVAILYTDAWWHALTPDEFQRCKDTCAKYNIRFYAAIYSRPEAEPNGIKRSLRELAEVTGGRLYDGIISTEEAASLAVELKAIIQNTEPCTIEWISDQGCTTVLDCEASIPAHGLNDEFTYNSSFAISKLEVRPIVLKMRNVAPGSYKDTILTVTAYYKSMTVFQITPTHGSFSIVDFGGSSPPFMLQMNESRILKIRFAPTDSSRVFSSLNIESDGCIITNTHFSGGFPGFQTAQQDLRLTSPNGGEVFLAGSDTVITWKGISNQEMVTLEYSLDKGNNWKPITSKATGLTHQWNIPNNISNECLVRVQSFPDVEKTDDWAKRISGPHDYDYIKSMATDLDGNLYILGDFKSYLDFGNKITLYKTATNNSLFLAKFDNKGNAIWAKNPEGLFDNISTSLACDDMGNIIIHGRFNSPKLDFGSGVIIGHDKWTPGDWNIFVAKYSPDGDILWAKNIGEDGKSDWSGDVTVDGSGHILLFGYSNGGFLSMYDENGTLQWLKKIESLNLSSFTGVVVENNNIYISGNFEAAELDFGSGIKLSNKGAFTTFIAKYQINGNIVWAKGWGSKSYKGIEALSMASDGYGSIYTCGYYTESLDLGNGTTLTNLGGTDGFLIKYDEDGNIGWATGVGGNGSDVVKSVACDENGYIYICGDFTSPNVEFSDGSRIINSGKSDVFLAQYNPLGKIRWVKKADGLLKDEANSIVSYKGSTYVGGKYYSPSLDMNNSIILPAARELSDFFIAKYESGIEADQSDTSDAVFSIVKPLATSQNIDMGRVLVTSSKDSLIQTFITNTGSYPIRIDAINITGANASEFQLASGIPPFTIPVGDKKPVEFRFRPSAVGGRSADLVVITQADTLRQTIIGEGVKPVIQVAASLIDFGIIEVGSLKDTTVTAVLKNIGDVPLSITNTQMLGPDKEQFQIISGGGNFSLAAGAEQTMQLRFSPKYIGRTSGQIGFDYAGMAGGRPAVVQLFGQGIGGMAYVVDDSAYIGKTYDMKLMLGKIKPSSVAQTAATSFKAKLAFSNTILTPVESTLSAMSVFKKGTEVDTLEITRQWNTQSSELARIPMNATLGDRIQTDVELLEFDWLDDTGKSIGYDTEMQSGVFKTLGICEEGGERLYDIDGQAQMMMIAPNPANGGTEITFETVERGATRIMITDVLGRQQVLKSGEFTKGTHSFEFDTEGLTSGTYILTMQTPTQIFTQQIIINK